MPSPEEPFHRPCCMPQTRPRWCPCTCPLAPAARTCYPGNSLGSHVPGLHPLHPRTGTPGGMGGHTAPSMPTASGHWSTQLTPGCCGALPLPPHKPLSTSSACPAKKGRTSTMSLSVPVFAPTCGGRSCSRCRILSSRFPPAPAPSGLFPCMNLYLWVSPCILPLFPLGNSDSPLAFWLWAGN